MAKEFKWESYDDMMKRVEREKAKKSEKAKPKKKKKETKRP